MEGPERLRGLLDPEKRREGPNALTNLHFTSLWGILIIQENELHEDERVMK